MTKEYKDVSNQKTKNNSLHIKRYKKDIGKGENEKQQL